MSFFKRAVVGALERREEVRDANQLKYEADVTAGITKLNEAEKEMKKNNLIVRNRKKLITPIGMNVFNETGYKFSEPVLLNVLMSSKGDADLATDTLVRMAKSRTPDTTTTVTDGMEGFTQESASTRDLSDMSGDTTRALQDASSMISTTSTQLPSQQKALITTKENERTQRYGGGFAGNILNTLLGGVSGPSVREAVKERYSSMFRTPEEGEQAYTDAMNYMEEVRDKGEASTVPDLPPNMLADIQRETRKAKKYETFEKNLVTEVPRQLNDLKNLIINKNPDRLQQLAAMVNKSSLSNSDLAGLPETIQRQVKEFMKIKEETIRGSTSIFNNTNVNSAVSATQQFLNTPIGADGKTQLDIFQERMIGGTNKRSSKPITSKPNAKKIKSSVPTVDLSEGTKLSFEQLMNLANTDDREAFIKKYRKQAKTIRDPNSNTLAHLYVIEGNRYVVSSNFDTIRKIK
tara:strand:+ start:4053 stop:5441 length:1389 start_codon:yes stop_codon:yes gene_type:complete